MTLPASFPLSVSQINVELGRASNAAFDIQGTAERGLAQVPSGPIDFSDFLGKSLRGVVQTDSRLARDSGSSSTHNYNAVDLGTATTNSHILIFAVHGDTGTNPGTNPTCTVAGSPINKRTADSTGDDTSGSDATGTAIFEMDASAVGGTQNITIVWGATNVSIVVVRVTGYSFASPVFGSNAGTSFDGSATFNIPDKAVVLFIASSGQSSADIVWGGDGIVERGQNTNYGAGTNNVRSWAWQTEIPANASYDVTMSPHSNAQGSNSWSYAVLAAA